MAGTFYIRVRLVFQREGDQWTGHCPELGTATCGDTLDETLQALREAILLHIKTLEDVGECERFLKENKIKFYRRRPTRTRIETDLHLLDEEVFVDERIVPVSCA